MSENWIFTNCVRREASSIGELNQAITPSELNFEGSRAGCKLDIFELGAVLECGIANSLEVFVEDDALEGGARGERQLFDDFEVIGEGGALECGTALECGNADSPEVFVADDAFEGLTIGERQAFDDGKLIGESDTREGKALLECCHF